MDPEELKTIFKKFKIKPNKKLGQNFLVSEKALKEIVSAAELEKSDTVLEIGPGLGGLTKKLSKTADLVLAVEKDQKMVDALHRIFRNQKNVKIIKGDALFVNTSSFELQNSGYKLVANIPYYITGKLLKNFLTNLVKPAVIVLLVQKEVAERIVAKPAKMSVLSLSVQFFGNPELVAIVPRESFFPQPQVDSAIIKIKIFPQPKINIDEKRFFQIVKIAFSSPRKLLQNNLASGLRRPKEEIAKILAELNIPVKARAQDLAILDWEKLIKKLF